MSLTVVLQDERGVAVEGVDDAVLPGAAMPALGDQSYVWAATIDPYGDTTFNRYQAQLLGREWPRIISMVTDAATVAALEKVGRLLKRCEEGTHLYVKFIGD